MPDQTQVESTPEVTPTRSGAQVAQGDLPSGPDSGSASLTPEDFLGSDTPQNTFDYGDFANETIPVPEEPSSTPSESTPPDAPTTTEEGSSQTTTPTTSETPETPSENVDDLIARLEQELTYEDVPTTTPAPEPAQQVQPGITAVTPEVAEPDFEEMSTKEQMEYLLDQRLKPIQQNQLQQHSDQEFNQLLGYFGPEAKTSIANARGDLDAVIKQQKEQGLNYTGAFMLNTYQQMYSDRYKQGLLDGLKRADSKASSGVDSGSMSESAPMETPPVNPVIDSWDAAASAALNSPEFKDLA